MSDEYFDHLSVHAIKFDADVKKLTEIWRHPHQVLSGYGADLKQGEADLQKLRVEMTTLKNDMINDRRAREKDIAEMDTFIEDTEKQIKEMIENCNNLDSVMSEYGYIAPKPESTPNKSEMTRSENSSLIVSDVSADLLEHEFTPHMAWRQKPRVNTLSGNAEPDPNLVSKIDKLFVNSSSQE